MEVEVSRAKGPEQAATLEKRRVAVEKKAATALITASKALSVHDGGGAGGDGGLPTQLSPSPRLSIFSNLVAELPGRVEAAGGGSGTRNSVNDLASPSPARLPRPSWAGTMGAAIMEGPMRVLNLRRPTSEKERGTGGAGFGGGESNRRGSARRDTDGDSQPPPPPSPGHQLAPGHVRRGAPDAAAAPAPLAAVVVDSIEAATPLRAGSSAQEGKRGGSVDGEGGGA